MAKRVPLDLFGNAFSFSSLDVVDRKHEAFELDIPRIRLTT